MSEITKKSATGVHHRGYSIEQAIRKTDKFATIAAEVILDWLAPIRPSRRTLLGRRKFPGPLRKFPVMAPTIPCSVAQGISLQGIEFAARAGAKIASRGRILQNSLLISLLAGNSVLETGSMATAFATTHSSVNRRFPVSDQYAQFCGLFRDLNEGRAVSARHGGARTAISGAQSLGSANPFLATVGAAVPGSNRQAKHRILAGPLGAASRRRVTPRQSSFDGSLHQPGCKESQRYRHVDLANAAMLARSNLLDSGGTGSNLINPTTATCDLDATSVARVSARMGRASWRCRLGYDDLTPPF